MSDIIFQIETKEKEIEWLKEELENVEGTECEVYSRIVGFYRPIKAWNPGKKEEFNLRKVFVYRMDK
jgi:anaerobic ribonucleoside-triphosphate reductase